MVIAALKIGLAVTATWIAVLGALLWLAQKIGQAVEGWEEPTEDDRIKYYSKDYYRPVSRWDDEPWGTA